MHRYIRKQHVLSSLAFRPKHYFPPSPVLLEFIRTQSAALKGKGGA